MRPIETSEATGIYHAPDGLEAVVGGLPFWRERGGDGLETIRSVWKLSDDEREAVALGGTVLVGIIGEPIPPISIDVLSPIDVRAFGMEPLGDVQLIAVDAVRPAAYAVLLLIAFALVAIGFWLGKITG